MIDSLLSSALNDSKISHEEFTNIITEKNVNENIKENNTTFFILQNMFHLVLSRHFQLH